MLDQLFLKELVCQTLCQGCLWIIYFQGVHIFFVFVFFDMTSSEQPSELNNKVSEEKEDVSQAYGFISLNEENEIERDPQEYEYIRVPSFPWPFQLVCSCADKKNIQIRKKKTKT